MSSRAAHVIRREHIDLVVVGAEAQGFALQGRIAELCRDWLTPALDEAFERAAPGDEHWQFERIDVDVGSFTPDKFERGFVAAVVAAVEKRIRERRDDAALDGSGDSRDGVRRSGAQSTHAAFRHFLVTGALPWWWTLPSGRTLEAQVETAWAGDGPPAAERTALLDLLAAPVARLRLARQFSPRFLDLLLERLAPGACAVLRDAVAAPHAVSAAGSNTLPADAWAAAFACLAAGRPVTRTSVLEAWAALAPGTVRNAASPGAGDAPPPVRAPSPPADVPPARPAGEAATQPPHEAAPAPAAGAHVARPSGLAAATFDMLDLDGGAYVGCAGVVLLHPFLPMLFERLGVSVDNRLAQPDRALALLHLLATGETRAPEHALVLPKLLCGLAPSALAGAPVELTEEDCREAVTLLTSAIGHWGALGDTTPDALRGTFLVRPGKLSRRGDDDLLQVETQGYDILLGQLPWGLGPVRLPWMRRFLWVEWPY